MDVEAIPFLTHEISPRRWGKLVCLHYPDGKRFFLHQMHGWNCSSCHNTFHNSFFPLHMSLTSQNTVADKVHSAHFFVSSLRWWIQVSFDTYEPTSKIIPIINCEHKLHSSCQKYSQSQQIYVFVAFDRLSLYWWFFSIISELIPHLDNLEILIGDW